MRKKLLCFYLLMCYLFVCCTFLSNKIEEEMTTQVVLLERKNRGTFGLRTNLLFQDQEGWHFYNGVYGTGWNTGLRAEELDKDRWSMDAYRGELDFGGSDPIYRFIQTASRQPTPGEKLKVVDSFTFGPDQYLFLYPDGAPEDFKEPQFVPITARSDRAVLLSYDRTRFPFFEHATWDLTVSARTAERVVSLVETRAFLENIPAAVSALVPVGIGLVLWLCLAVLSVSPRENAWLMAGNVAAMAATIPVLRTRLAGFHLPASLLPPEHIFDVTYYREEFQLILDGLSTLDVPAKELIPLAEQTAESCEKHLLRGALLAVAILLGQMLLLLARKRWKTIATKKAKIVGDYPQNVG